MEKTILRNKAYFNWSSGKDSALALYWAIRDGLPVRRLLTTLNATNQRVSMHGLPHTMLERQARAIGLPLQTVSIPEDVSMESYDAIMDQTIIELKAQGYSQAVFGDIFLEDLRKYREQRLALHGIGAFFPLWKKDTRQLAEQFWQLGFRAIVVCIDCSKLDPSFLGVEWTPQWVERLPPGVDPCGERGEFHTFCFNAPFFSSPVGYRVMQTVFKTYPQSNPQVSAAQFAFCELLPDED